MQPRWRLLLSPPASGYHNMAMDEALLLSLQQGSGLPTLRFYSWQPPCLSVGYFQSVREEVDLEYLRKQGLDMVRRPTGGGAVLHDREVTYSLVAREEDPLLSGNILESYRKVSLGILAGLRRLGAEVEMAPPLRHQAPRSGACFDEPAAYEILFWGRKLVGSAQVRRSGFILQQGSILLDFDAEGFLPILKPRGNRSREGLLERVATLKEALGEMPPWDELVRSLAYGFAQALGLELERGNLSPEEESLAQKLEAGKYRRLDWNLKR